MNLFVGSGAAADPAAVVAYAARLAALAERAGVALGTPRFDDDAFAAKVDALVADPVAVVSFTFGLPPAEAFARLRGAGSRLWLTVTSPEEALAAVALEPDALIVQGVEAGGHRGVFRDDEDASDLTLLSALQLIRAVVDVPLVAAGGIGSGAAVGAVLVAGASAAQVGTAYLRAWRPARRRRSARRSRAPRHGADARLQRPAGARDHEPLARDPRRRRAPRLPRGAPPDLAAARPRPQGRRPGPDQPVGGPGAPAGRGAARGEITRRLADEARAAIEAAARRL